MVMESALHFDVVAARLVEVLCEVVCAAELAKVGIALTPSYVAWAH